MATEKTIQERLQEWSDEVVAEYTDESEDALAFIQEHGGPDAAGTMAAIDWSNSVDFETLMFTLSICVAELVRRYGTELTNETLSGLLDEPDLVAIGEVVHAQHVVEEGGMPLRFQAEDTSALVAIALDPDNDGIVINMDTGETIT